MGRPETLEPAPNGPPISPWSGDSAALLPPDTTAWIISSGLIGHEINCRGIASALGLSPQIRRVSPRLLFAAFAPFGPIDPREAADRPNSPVAPPFPDLLIASGRRAVPYLRYLKRASKGRTFTLFMQDPRTGRRAADAIWVAEHDDLRGDNVIVTLTSPHILRPEVLAAARRRIDPRIADLPRPRIAMVLGGDSLNHRFRKRDAAALKTIVALVLQHGYGLMVTPSRRTPKTVRAAIREALGGAKAFLDDGTGSNPYVDILANADAIIVTGDSVNMVGEAVATGVPVHVYEPSGGHPKMTGFLDRLVEAGAVRRWRGRLEQFDYPPIDATPVIAREVARRFLAFRMRLPPLPCSQANGLLRK
jgi:mitochondrial fission protein ELM1